MFDSILLFNRRLAQPLCVFSTSETYLRLFQAQFSPQFTPSWIWRLAQIVPGKQALRRVGQVSRFLAGSRLFIPNALRVFSASEGLLYKLSCRPLVATVFSFRLERRTSASWQL